MSGNVSYETIEYCVEDGVAVISLNVPDRLNAVSPVMGEELISSLEHAETEARCVLLRGNGKAFCSGANLADGRFSFKDPDRDAGASLETAFNPLVRKMRFLEIPLVTEVRGAAAGIGCSLALMGDMIVASDTAYFYQAFRQIGLVPDGGASYVLSRTIGRVRAMQMMLGAEKIGAAKALEWGMVSLVVPDDELGDAARKVAAGIAQGPKSTGMIRLQAWQGMDACFDDQLKHERDNQRIAGRTEDFAEGIRAFQQKRLPEFRGH